jgi:hypothetical protein
VRSLINLENFKKQVYFGYYLDLTLFDFKIDYNTVGTGHSGKKKTTGFNVGIVG